MIGPLELLRNPSKRSSFLECLCHLFDAYLVRVIGHRVDFLGSFESLSNIVYTVQPFQG